MEKVLRLGRTDANSAQLPGDRRAFFDLYHHPHGFRKDDLRFRDDSRNEWRPLEAIEGQRIVGLTRFLQSAGFMPNANHDGIFGYVTQAAVRLFQEYTRTLNLPFESDPPCWPDGVVGEDTRQHIDKWVSDGRRCHWSAGTATADFNRWMQWLSEARSHYRVDPTTQMRQLAEATTRGDSLIPADWRFDGDEPHLIGIRRNAGRPQSDSASRPPDDLFVLLLNGRSFYFLGSTDPNPSGRREAYLTEGQHLYRFNWHNIGDARRDRIYKAGRPAGAGVMVTRDVHGQNALTEENLRDGFDASPNPTINIHWNGLGISNWSAGCQVISGSHYLDDAGKRVDCRAYTARNDRERGTRNSPAAPRRTMGAYTFLSDLLLCYTRQTDPAEKPIFRYTLLSEEVFSHLPGVDITHSLSQLQAN